MLPPLATLPFFNANVVALISTLSVVVRSISDPLPTILIPSAPSKVNAPEVDVKLDAAPASMEIAPTASKSIEPEASTSSTPASRSTMDAAFSFASI